MYIYVMVFECHVSKGDNGVKSELEGSQWLQRSSKRSPRQVIAREVEQRSNYQPFLANSWWLVIIICQERHAIGPASLTGNLYTGCDQRIFSATFKLSWFISVQSYYHKSEGYSHPHAIRRLTSKPVELLLIQRNIEKGIFFSN